MKIRLNYVSNSSSSSFIIAYNKDAFFEIAGSSIKIKINDYFHSWREWSEYSDATILQSYDKENTLRYLQDKADNNEYDRDYNLDLINKIEKITDKEVIKINIGYYDYVNDNIFKALCESGLIEVINKYDD